MPSIRRFLVSRAQAVAHYRRRLYGLEVPHDVAAIVASVPPLSAGQALVLGKYIASASPRRFFGLAWHYFTDRDTPARRRKIQALAGALRERLSAGARVIEGYFERRIYSRDVARVPQYLEKSLHRTTPLLVVQPGTEGDILATLRFSSEHRLPVYPRGTASSAFGGAVPTMNGVVIDFSPMARIVGLDLAARTVTVEPGVRWADLIGHLRSFGFSPVTTPTSLFSTVAGWACTGGLGVNSFGYGHFHDAVLAARIALPDGSVVALTRQDSRLREFFGTEGQFGVFTQLTLRLRESSTFSKPFLFHFVDAGKAFGFIDGLLARGCRPSHVAFYDRVRLKEENELFQERTAGSRTIVQEQEAVFLHFDSAANLDKFVADMPGAPPSDDLAARYLWSERFFPLKAQRRGPSMLASEVVLPRSAVPDFMLHARQIARHFGNELAFEVFVARTEEKRDCVVIASFLCDSGRWDYSLRLLLVQLLTYLGVCTGGRPYGFGIWNSPFLGRLFSKAEIERMAELKRAVDPACVLNPQKFFRVRSRLFNIPALLFIPQVHEAGLKLARFTLPILGPMLRLVAHNGRSGWRVPGEEERRGEKLITETLARCTSCGACISVCPAYLVTRQELVTGRAKLRLAEALMAGEEVRLSEAASPFQCLHCGLCEEVCQTALPLRDCYRVLERWLCERFERPDKLIEAFARTVDQSPEIVMRAYGLSQPDWSPVPEPAGGPTA